MSCYFLRTEGLYFWTLELLRQGFNLEPQLFRTRRLKFEGSIILLILIEVSKGEYMMVEVKQNMENRNHFSLEEKLGICMQQKISA